MRIETRKGPVTHALCGATEDYACDIGDELVSTCDLKGFGVQKAWVFAEGAPQTIVMFFELG